MKKVYFLVVSLLAVLSFGQAFTATYDFASVTTSTGATDPTPVPTATGVTFGSFTAVNGTTAPTNSSGAGRFSFNNQPLGATTGVDTFSTLTGSVDTGIYFQTTVTPASGFTIDLSTITFKVQRSGTGIRTYVVRSSQDGFAANLGVISINPANAILSAEAGNVFFWTADATTSGQVGSTITLSGFTGISSAVTLRFYGYNAEANGGTFSIDDVVISGTANPTAGISEISLQDKVKLYPSIVSDFATVELEGSFTAEVYNMNGQLLSTEKGTNTVQLSTASLEKGTYFVRISQNGESTSQKFIKK